MSTILGYHVSPWDPPQSGLRDNLKLLWLRMRHDLRMYDHVPGYGVIGSIGDGWVGGNPHDHEPGDPCWRASYAEAAAARAVPFWTRIGNIWR